MSNSAQKDSPIFTLRNVTIRLGDQFILPNTSWQIRRNQHWAVLGPNGAGKSTLVRALAGEVPIVRGKITRHDALSLQDQIGYVSFELHHVLIAREARRNEFRSFSGNLDDFTTVKDILDEDIPQETSVQDAVNSLLKRMEIGHLLDRPLEALSTGEMRKLLITKALIKSPKILILDEPFGGLDAHSRKHLAEMLNGLMDGEIQLILVTHRLDEIVSNISHILCIKNSKVLAQGRRDHILNSEMIKSLFGSKSSRPHNLSIQTRVSDQGINENQKVLISMENTTVKYGKTLVIETINWKMKKGENWIIHGPNGAGKTTLLSLITGDNPQVYANEVYLFGKRRGEGESLWEIKKEMGFVSSEFQTHYQKHMRAYDVVLSGFFDSIGLYRYATPVQQKTAGDWTEKLGIAPIAHRRFDQLSYGEQRMVLLARSMVKSPALLILDEPCQGLDRGNRETILGWIDFIGNHTRTNLLYVTHRREELPSCITHRMQFVKTQRGTYSITFSEVFSSGI